MSLTRFAIGALLALASLSSISELRAQCTPITGTGCQPNTRPPQCRAAPQINTRLAVACPACTSGTPFVIAGAQLTIFPTLLPPIACDRIGCVQSCQPFIVIAGSSLAVDIPNDPRLVGVNLCVQCGCLDTTCLTLSTGLSVVIQP